MFLQCFDSREKENENFEKISLFQCINFRLHLTYNSKGACCSLITSEVAPRFVATATMEFLTVVLSTLGDSLLDDVIYTSI